MLISKLLVDQLIDLVKRNPVLYDINHASRRNSDVKQLAWREISLKLDVEENMVRAKWKNLRDCYKKHLRANATDETNTKVRAYKHWQWAQQLEFLRPHSDDTAAYADETVYYDENHEQLALTEVKLEHRNYDPMYDSENIDFCVDDDEAPKERKRRKFSPESKPVQAYLQDGETIGLDAIEHIFLGYAKTIKKLPVKSQITVKMKIAKLIMEEELKCLKYEPRDILDVGRYYVTNFGIKI